MSYVPRTLEVLQQEFFKHLVENNSVLTDVTPGSVVYTLMRSIAAGALEQERLFAEAARGMTLNLASGAQLDSLLADYNIQRIPATPASGYVLIKSEFSTPVPVGTAIVNPATQLVYITTSPVTVTIGETAVPIIAELPGAAYNMEAGTPLLAPNFLNFTIVVGSHRTTGGEACTPCTGGVNAESDLALVQRFQAGLLATPGSLRHLQAVVLNNSLVADVRVQETENKIIFWVEGVQALSIPDLNALSELIKDNKAAGVSFEIKPLVRQNLFLVMTIKHDRIVNLSDLQARVEQVCELYINSLQHQEPFLWTALANKLQQIQGVQQADIVSPANLSVPDPEKIFSLAEVKVSYVS